MKAAAPNPGISRPNRLSDEGLARLQKQLSSSANISDTVLAQWIRRYGEAARELIRQHGRYSAAFEQIPDPAEKTDE